MGQTTPSRDRGSARRRARPRAPEPGAGDPFWQLVATARRLQAPGGCAWDRAQTVASLTPYLIEEAWEVFDAVRRRRWPAIQEELGDVLYTILFQSLIAQRQGRGSLRGMLRAVRRKMIRRHAHVFGWRRARTAQEASGRWQASKRLEPRRGPSPSNAFRRRLVRMWQGLEPPREDTPGRRRAGLRGSVQRPAKPMARQRDR